MQKMKAANQIVNDREASANANNSSQTCANRTKMQSHNANSTASNPAIIANVKKNIRKI